MPADISDRKDAFYLLEGKRSFLPSLSYIYGDDGYEGHNFIETIKQRTGWTLTIVKRSTIHELNPLPKQWIIERTFAWFNKNRRLSKDYELYAQTAKAFIYLAMIRLILRRNSLLL